MTDPELYALEEASVKFQNNISALLEVHSQFIRKTEFARLNKKEFISFPIHEAQVTQDYLLKVIGALAGSYDVMVSSSKHLIFQKRLVEQLNGKK